VSEPSSSAHASALEIQHLYYFGSALVKGTSGPDNIVKIWKFATKEVDLDVGSVVLAPHDIDAILDNGDIEGQLGEYIAALSVDSVDTDGLLTLKSIGLLGLPFNGGPMDGKEAVKDAFNQSIFKAGRAILFRPEETKPLLVVNKAAGTLKEAFQIEEARILLQMSNAG
jgi:hypothetical protein